MAKEVEAKFKIGSERSFRKVLKKAGASLLSRELEKDVYYNNLPGCRGPGAIRLRSVGDKGLFTVKSQNACGSSGTYKVRDEFEVAVADAEAFAHILKILGFKPSFRKEKLRATYGWRGAKICVDTLPFIGSYVEIEAPKKKIKEAAEALALDMSKAIPDTYMELFNYYKLRHGRPELEFSFKRGRV